MKVSCWKILVAGILFAIVGQIIHSLGAFLGMSYYTDPTYFKV